MFADHSPQSNRWMWIVLPPVANCECPFDVTHIFTHIFIVVIVMSSVGGMNNACKDPILSIYFERSFYRVVGISVSTPSGY